MDFTEQELYPKPRWLRRLLRLRFRVTFESTDFDCLAHWLVIWIRINNGRWMSLFWIESYGVQFPESVHVQNNPDLYPNVAKKEK